MNSTHDLTIIIPACNEEENLRLLLPDLLEFVKKNSWELIIINDGSKDKTRDLLKEWGSEECLTVLTNKVNRGYGGAIKEGIKASRTEYSITIDADGQHYFDDIAKLYKIIKGNDADMVVGSRIGLKADSNVRRFGKWLIRNFAKLLMPIHIYDINSGMKIYRTVLAQKYLKMYPDTMAFSDVIVLVFINYRHLVLEEPIKIRERKAGTSKVSINSAFQTIMEIINILTLFNPMKLFLPISVGLIIFGIFWTLQFALKGMGVSVGGSLLIISGLMVFLIGLVAEQLSAIRKQ